jgi:hypothetical protein
MIHRQLLDTKYAGGYRFLVVDTHSGAHALGPREKALALWRGEHKCHPGPDLRRRRA